MLTPKPAIQALVDGLKIPWMSGAPSEPLLVALQAKLASEAEPQVGLWETIAPIEQKFGKTIDLTTPPAGLQASP